MQQRRMAAYWSSRIGYPKNPQCSENTLTGYPFLLIDPMIAKLHFGKLNQQSALRKAVKPGPRGLVFESIETKKRSSQKIPTATWDIRWLQWTFHKTEPAKSSLYNPKKSLPMLKSKSVLPWKLLHFDELVIKPFWHLKMILGPS